MFWKLCCSTQSLSFQNSFNKQKYFNLMYLWGLEVNTYFYWNIAPFYFSSLQRLSNIKFRPHLLWQISKCKWTCIKYIQYSYYEKLKEISTLRLHQVQPQDIIVNVIQGFDTNDLTSSFTLLCVHIKVTQYKLSNFII